VSRLVNYTYHEIKIGQTATYTKAVTEQDIQLFSIVSGDVNPVHLDEEYAATTMFKGRIAHGMLTGAFISAALALELPGPGTIYLGQSLRFKLPVKIDDEITVTLEVIKKRDDRKFVTLSCVAVNQKGKVVVSGSAEVMAPEEKIDISRPAMPSVTIG